MGAPDLDAKLGMDNQDSVSSTDPSSPGAETASTVIEDEEAGLQGELKEAPETEEELRYPGGEATLPPSEEDRLTEERSDNVVHGQSIMRGEASEAGEEGRDARNLGA